jgi:hypothetical protein
MHNIMHINSMKTFCLAVAFDNHKGIPTAKLAEVLIPISKPCLQDVPF